VNRGVSEAPTRAARPLPASTRPSVVADRPRTSTARSTWRAIRPDMNRLLADAAAITVVIRELPRM
jgi:hypothetical protein